MLVHMKIGALNVQYFYVVVVELNLGILSYGLYGVRVYVTIIGNLWIK